MTAEEKLTIIRKQAQEEFVHYSRVSHDFPGSEMALKSNWAEKWMDFIENLCNEDPETMEDYNDPDQLDWEAEAKKRAGEINYSRYTNRIDLYMRGFGDGQWWRKNNQE